MHQKRIQTALQDALEEKVPASKINLWPAIKDQLAVGKQIPLQGDKMNNTRIQRIPRYAFALVILVALLSIFLLTPQGKIFAQSVIQLFTQADNPPLNPQDVPQAANGTGSSLPTALPPAPLVSVSDAEVQIGFSVAALPYSPEGLSFLGARVYNNQVNLEYETANKAGHLIIAQSRGEFNQSDWDFVPPEAVTPVTINGYEGEFVVGTFVLYPGAQQGTWNPDANMLRLRWEKDGILYEITKYGDDESIRYLDQHALIKIAEDLNLNP